jgi:hypothetical protein
VTDDVAAQAKEIIVGKTNREDDGNYTVDRTDLGDDGLMIKTLGEKLVIAGGETRGTLYGVYTFLEEVLDCHWYTSTLIVIPTMDDLQVPVDIEIIQKPYFEYRETDWISPRDEIYSMANKLNGNSYRKLSEAQGGSVGYTSGFCHTLTRSIVSSDKYFETHPEYYAWNEEEQERLPTQLCLTNPDVLEIAIQEVRDILAANPNAHIISDDKRIRPEKSEVFRLFGDNSKIIKHTNWKVENTLEQGLQQTIDWFSNKENLRQYKAGIYNV